MLLLICVQLIGSIMTKLSKRSDILSHDHRPLFQILELLQLDDTLRHMVGAETGLEFLLVDALVDLVGAYWDLWSLEDNSLTDSELATGHLKKFKQNQ
jgi:hypothetical protein